MRWMNPYPPEGAYLAHSARRLWRTSLAVAVVWSAVTLERIWAGDNDAGVFLAVSPTAAFAAALWAMSEERRNLTDYITRKHFS